MKLVLSVRARLTAAIRWWLTRRSRRLDAVMSTIEVRLAVLRGDLAAVGDDPRRGAQLAGSLAMTAHEIAQLLKLAHALAGPGADRRWTTAVDDLVTSATVLGMSTIHATATTNFTPRLTQLHATATTAHDAIAYARQSRRPLDRPDAADTRWQREGSQ